MKINLSSFFYILSDCINEPAHISYVLAIDKVSGYSYLHLKLIYSSAKNTCKDRLSFCYSTDAGLEETFIFSKDLNQRGRILTMDLDRVKKFKEKYNLQPIFCTKS